jgi:2,3-bisphosphoglycerate-independent phosphoglycerate mutase
MKYCIIVPDGMADLPLETLAGKTPVEAAYTPHLDSLVQQGVLGLARFVPRGMEPGSDVAHLSILGYDPVECYTGRGPLEAASRGVALGPRDCAFRCNLVTVSDGKMADYSAGKITNKEAAVLIELLNQELGSEEMEFHPGVSYRNLMVLRERGKLEAKCTPPHDIPDQPIKNYLPKGKDASFLRDLMARAEALLASHEINEVRTDLGENPANMIWLWGGGPRPRLVNFEQRFGVRGAAIAAVDLIRGIANYLDFDLIEVPGATGYLDTNYAGKGEAACNAVADYDLVLVHIEAPDEASHEADTQAKVEAIEKVDKFVVAPIMEVADRLKHMRVMVAADHLTPIAEKTHVSDPSPFAIAGEGIGSMGISQFSEALAETSGLRFEKGHELIHYFLGEQAN